MTRRIALAITLMIVAAPICLATAEKKPIQPIPAPQQMVNVDGTWRPVKGLTEIRHEKVLTLAPSWLVHRDVFIYEVDHTETLYETYGKIAQVKDLRSFETAHPIKATIAKNLGNIFNGCAWMVNRSK